MILHLKLESGKGVHEADIAQEFDQIACLSDAAQRIPKWILARKGKLYGYYGMNIGKKAHFVFREKELVECE